MRVQRHTFLFLRKKIKNRKNKQKKHKTQFSPSMKLFMFENCFLVFDSFVFCFFLFKNFFKKRKVCFWALNYYTTKQKINHQFVIRFCPLSFLIKFCSLIKFWSSSYVWESMKIFFLFVKIFFLFVRICENHLNL